MRRRVRFTGRVQGVGFRVTARSLAGAHPVTGWVRNEPDGSVLLEVQGADGGVAAFLADLRRTMERCIRSADESVIDDVAEETGFVIRR